MPGKKPTSTPLKPPKTDHLGPDDFSNSVKKRLASSTRTGQACDRCKVRKIRCDGLPGGCSPCLQNNTECRTTDRITGRATSRGYVEGLERRSNEMEGRIHELETRLRAMGVDVASSPPFAGPAEASLNQVASWNAAANNSHDPSQYWSASDASDAGTAANGTSSSPDPMLLSSPETNIFRALPIFRAGCTGDNYLGISSGNSNLSSIKGTALSLLGMEIDIADFQSTDMDEPSNLYQPDLYNKSYQSYLQTALNVNPKIDKPPLPGRDQGLTYAEWYFRVLMPYVPVLHRPTFIKLLTRIYDDREFTPTAAETTMVHMMFATMFFQYAARNWENASQQAELNRKSNEHYHYALSFYYDLCASHTLSDVQALTMICSHLRHFPKPGASWMATNTVFTLAIELGLHRSAKRWVQQSPHLNHLEIEMRKRVFWCLLANHVLLSGKLGRPMPLRLEDFDVELPEALDDECLSEDGIGIGIGGAPHDAPRRCPFAIGIESFKLMTLFIELFNLLYSPKRVPAHYVENVVRLEAKVQAWRDQWPAELAGHDHPDQEPDADPHPDPHPAEETRVFSIYVHTWFHEFRILLRHPAASLTSSPDFNSESIDICVTHARELLHKVKELQKLRSLDTTWYNGAIYLMAITISLYAQWQRRDEVTADSLGRLREEMELWLDIMGDVGGLLGSGTRLKQAVRSVTDGTLGMLTRELHNTGMQQKRRASGGEPPSPKPATTKPAKAPLQDYTNHTQNHVTTNHAQNNINSGYFTDPSRPPPLPNLTTQSNSHPHPSQSTTSHPHTQTTSHPPNSSNSPSAQPFMSDANGPSSTATLPYDTGYTYTDPVGGAPTSNSLAATYGGHPSNVFPASAYAAAAAAVGSPDGSMPLNHPHSVHSSHPHPSHTPQQHPGIPPSVPANFLFTAGPGTPAAAAANAAAAAAAAAAAGGPGPASWNPGSQSWRQWTGQMTSNLEPQDCYSASALMQLGGRSQLAAAAADAVNATSAMADMSVVEPSHHLQNHGLAHGQGHPHGAHGHAGQLVGQPQGAWPLMIFGLGNGTPEG